MAQVKKNAEEGRKDSASSNHTDLGWLKRTGLVAGTVIVGALPTKVTAGPSFLLDASGGGIYEKSPISSLGNIPLGAKSMSAIQWNHIPPCNIGLENGQANIPDFITLGTVRIGAEFGKDRWLTASGGIGLDFGEQTGPGYYQMSFAGKKGRRTAYEQLKYEFCGADWDNFMRPFAFVELDHKLTPNLSVGLGSKFAEEGLELRTGSEGCNCIPTSQTSDAVRVYEAMPYAHIKFETSNPERKTKLFVEGIVGFSRVMDAQFSEGISASTRDYAWLAGGEIGVRF
ncbi:MAG: hypothetical protein KGH94_04020 [Candidatus Micrarchaeota archaeon]|nr:hypothetical protein [Candidatus Micrarchaeota archaeon]